jgi:Holliday junction resolvase
MPRTPEQQRGLNFERTVADILGGAVVSGSGNKFYNRSDVRANGLIISCKSEKDMKWNKIRKQLEESIDYSHGTGDIPVLALQDIDYVDEFVVMRLSDLAKAFADGIKIDNSKESPGIEKRKKADIPLMLR